MFMIDQSRHEELLAMAREAGYHLELACDFALSADDQGKHKPQLINEHQSLVGMIAKIADEDGGNLVNSGSAHFKVIARYDAYKQILDIAGMGLNRVEAVSCTGRHEPTGQIALAL